MPRFYGQNAGVFGKILTPQPQQKAKLLAGYYTWFASSASMGLATIVVAALMAQNSDHAERYLVPLQQAKLTANVAVKVAVAEEKMDMPEGAALIASITPVAKPPAPVKLERETVSVELPRGENIVNLLTDNGISQEQALGAVQAMQKIYNPRRLQAGQEIQLKLAQGDEVATLEKLSMRVNPLETVTIQKSPSAGKYLAEMVEVSTKRKMVRAGGAIASSFYQTGINVGLSPQMVSELINAFSYDIDFQRDIQPGQQLDVLFENYVDENGKSVKRGEMKYASLMVSGKKLELYRYKDAFGNIGFYHPNGESIKKALLKTPVNGARISSGFGMRRHPILGYSKMHRGMDFAAPTGTPVYAAGDGIVQRASYFGSYGNYLAIKHNGMYASAYGHLSRFATGVRPGVRVRQGQVVAYIGTTGRSTGAHLHYEIHKYGAQINPNQAKLMAGNYLEGRQLAAFKAHVQQIRTQIAALPRTRIDLALR